MSEIVHTQECLDEADRFDREYAAFHKKYPNVCGTCGGSGQLQGGFRGSYYEPPDPPEPCDECILNDTCPLCASNLMLRSDGVNDWAFCERLFECGYDEENPTVFAPDRAEDAYGPCECYIDAWERSDAALGVD